MNRYIPTLEGDEAEEFIRKADEKCKARQKQNLIDMMEADEKLGLYQKPTKLYTIEDTDKNDEKSTNKLT